MTLFLLGVALGGFAGALVMLWALAGLYQHRRAEFKEELERERRYSKWAGRRIVRYEVASWHTIEDLTR